MALPFGHPARGDRTPAATLRAGRNEMTIDVRTRRQEDVRSLERDEILDAVLPDAVRVHGDLGARGIAYLDLPALALEVDGRAVTLAAAGDTVALHQGSDRGGVTAVLSADALSE